MLFLSCANKRRRQWGIPGIPHVESDEKREIVESLGAMDIFFFFSQIIIIANISSIDFDMLLNFPISVGKITKAVAPLAVKV